MSTTATLSTTHASQTSSPLTSLQCAQEYAALQNALQAGDLAAARRAYDTFWQEVAAQTESGRLFVPNAQTGHDLQAVGHSLRSANIPSAQRAFVMFHQNMLGAESNVPSKFSKPAAPYPARRQFHGSNSDR